MADLIERKAAIDALAEHEKSKGHNYTMFVDVVSECAEIIRDLPSAQPEQKVGKWIRHEDEDGEPYGHNCSICGEWYVMPYGKTKFCPNCGAKMEEQDADGA